MSPSYHFGEVAALAAGTIGPRGQRVFFMQVRDGASVLSFKLEKQQVTALAEYLADLLGDLPPVDVRSVPDLEPLVEPVVPEWTVGAMGVDFKADVDHFVLMAEEFDTSDEDEPFDEDDRPATLRFAIDRGQASAFITQARELVSAGRPPCPFCGRAWEPADDFCPCYN